MDCSFYCRCRWHAKITRLTAAGGNGSQCNKLTAEAKLNPSFVQPFYQTDQLWADVLYGRCTDPKATSYTIGKIGCALTSLTMAINYVQKAAPIPPPILFETPLSIQTFALTVDGFDPPEIQSEIYTRGKPGNEVNYGNIVANYKIPFAPKEKPFKWNEIAIRSINNPNANTDLATELAKGYPLIVAILHKRGTVDCSVTNPPGNCYYRAHFVLATDDLGGGSFGVVDPGRITATTLQSVIDYRAIKGAVGWETKGYVSVKENAYKLPKQMRDYTETGLSEESLAPSLEPTDETINQGSISIGSDEKVDFLVVNALGQKTGYDPITQNIIREIPFSSYNLDNIFPVEDPVPTTAVRSASISQPINGLYQVIIKGNITGVYNVSVNTSNRYAKARAPIVFTGTIQAGETITHTFSYSATNSSFDFDGDGKADLSVYRPGEGVWYIDQSRDGSTAFQWGIETDQLAAGDYDGDGRTDAAIFRDGAWWIRYASGEYAAFEFGQAGDKPVPADYDGDGKADPAVYRDGVWWIAKSDGSGFDVFEWGLPTDTPVPADYDGDGKTDAAVYRNGEWWIRYANGNYAAFGWGIATDKPVPADYDGDGKTDVAVYRDGTWWIAKSSGGYDAFGWGVATDTPVPADYDGDGKADPAVYRDGVWWILKSDGTGYVAPKWGLLSDDPLPKARD